MTVTQAQLDTYNAQFKDASLTTVITGLSTLFGSNLMLASSLGLEDQLLTHVAASTLPGITVCVLDTGRLHQETYDVLAKTMARYPNCHFRIYTPDSSALEALLASKGPNSFYDSVANRKACCQIRKLEPLARALKGKKAWITGLRRAQSVTRTDMALFEHDQQHGCIKVNPLIHWTLSEVKEAILDAGIVTNVLHDQGFPSIGCAPCTRAIKPGEDIRAGRWWWEAPEHKECGLHSALPKTKNKRNVS